MHLLFPVFLLEIRASDLDPHRSVFDFRPDPQMHGLWTERSQISSILLLRKNHGCGLWIRIQFLRIRIQLFFSMRIRILSELTKPYKKLPQWWKKTKNIVQKLKAMELVHIYFIFKNISTIFTNKFICLVYYRL